VNLSGDYGVSIIFNVFYHFLFDVGDDLISNFFRREVLIRINMHYKKIHERCRLGQGQKN
jgi:hypothetical protein